MSVYVLQWLRGEVEHDTADAKKLTLDFVSRLNEEVIRLNAWVHELRNPVPTAPIVVTHITKPVEVATAIQASAVQLIAPIAETPVAETAPTE